MRKFTLLLSWLCLSFYAHSQNCLNAGFENGSLEGYTTFIGKIQEDGTVSIDIPSFSRSQHHLMHVSRGVDPIAELYCKDNEYLPVVPPEGGAYTLRLGNSGSGAQAEKVVLKFKVTPELTFFQLRYAVVLNDPNHDFHEQPRFELRILDENGMKLCGEYIVRAAENIPGFERCREGWRVRPWTTAGFELKSFLGQNIQIAILTTDCSRGKHAGYAYFDATCEPLTITLEGYCPGSITANMRVTEGFVGYKWNTGNTEDTTNTVTIKNPIPGDVYEVTITSATGCTVVLQDTIPDITDYAIPKFSPEQDLTYCRDTSYWFSPQGEHLGDIYSSFHNRVGERFLINTEDTTAYTFIAQDPHSCFADTLSFSIDKGPIAVQATLDSISCFGEQDGAITVSATSDFTPFRYQWEHGVDTSAIDQLPEGRYTVTVSDNIHCTSTLSFELQNPPALLVEIMEEQPITCFGASDGRLVVDATGGTAPYEFLWSTVIDNTPILEQLTAGTYAVTITDAEGCTAIASTKIEEPTPLMIEPQMTAISCLGAGDGEIDLFITGGVGPYDTYWQDSLDLFAQSRRKLAAGEYTAVVRDQLGCTKEERFLLKAPSYHALCGVYIPTAFSPNADGVNDDFYVMGNNEKIILESLQIFNRWGDLVFDKDDDCSSIGDIDCGWSGMMNNQQAATGIYVYTIVLRVEGVDRSFLFKGEVLLVE